MPVHDRSSFENLYAGQPRWEIGRPQRALLDVADKITGSVLDAGCGTGENALLFASRGQRVNDLSPNTRRAFAQDARKFASWFIEANKEPLALGRVTSRDVSDFRDHLRRDKAQAVASVNRALVTLRRFFAWLVEQGDVAAIGEFLLGGWLRAVAAVGPRITLTGEVPADVASRLADALSRMESTPKDELHDALCGCPAGGKGAFCDFLRGGGFRLVDGAVTGREELR